jgi:hypothetical protein
MWRRNVSVLPALPGADLRVLINWRRYNAISELVGGRACPVPYHYGTRTNGNINNATNTVNDIRQADPPSVSTGTVVTPQPPVQQMPNGGSDVQRMRTNPPPSATR